MGNSTIARMTAREHFMQYQLGVMIFFSRGGGDVNNASKFCTTIFFQLAQRSPALKCGIVEAITKHRNMGTRRE